MMSWVRAFCVLFFLLAGIGSAWADRRVALVVGNGAYQHADQLLNPVTDARRMRDKLKELGFDVVYGEDLDQRSMNRIIGQFASAVEGSDVAIVYFAGHGATFGETPYVVPIDAEFESLDKVPYELVPVETLIGELRRSRGIRIAILDACRDNKAESALKRVATRGIGVSRGLAPVRDPNGLIIAYGTQYMSTAADGDPNGDSPFTTALLKHMATPGLDVKDMFFKVASDVISATDGLQRPEISISLYDPYTLSPDAPAAPLSKDVPEAPVRVPPQPQRQSPPPPRVAAPVEADLGPARAPETLYSFPINTEPDGWAALKAEPYLSSRRLGKVYDGTLFQVIGSVAGWKRVRFKSGQTGWIVSRLVGCCRPASP